MSFGRVDHAGNAFAQEYTAHATLLIYAMLQAAAYLHWVDWLRAASIKAGKRPLFINLDETSVSRSWPISGKCS